MVLKDPIDYIVDMTVIGRESSLWIIEETR